MDIAFLFACLAAVHDRLYSAYAIIVYLMAGSIRVWRMSVDIGYKQSCSNMLIRDNGLQSGGLRSGKVVC